MKKVDEPLLKIDEDGFYQELEEGYTITLEFETKEEARKFSSFMINGELTKAFDKYKER